jgi:hypothetical protein
MTPRLGDAWCHSLGAWGSAEKNRWLGRGFGLGVGLVLAGCTIGNPPPPVAGTRALYLGEQHVTAVCDRGHLVYITDKGAISVVAGGCPPDQRP